MRWPIIQNMRQQQKSAALTIIGGGSFGTSLAVMLAEQGYSVRIWVFEPELSATMNEKRENPLFLPGQNLPDSIRATSSLEEALGKAEMVLSVTPAQVLRSVWQRAVDHLPPDATIVSASKGIETGSGKLMSEVFEDILGSEASHRVAYLSGPSFAKEIVQGQPTAVVVASVNETLAKEVQNSLSTQVLRIYTTDDVIGVELGGALKNVIAIAVGVARGMGFGFNSQSALITRGLAEVNRLAADTRHNRFQKKHPATALRHEFDGLAGFVEMIQQAIAIDDIERVTDRHTQQLVKIEESRFHVRVSTAQRIDILRPCISAGDLASPVQEIAGVVTNAGSDLQYGGVGNLQSEGRKVFLTPLVVPQVMI